MTLIKRFARSASILILLLVFTFSCKEKTENEGETETETETTFETPQEFDYDPDLEEIGINPKEIQSVDSLLQSYVEDKKLNAVVGFVAKNGNVVYNKAFGFKDIENQIPANVDDYYVLFSQTKAVTTVAFMTLVEKGLVRIDDPISKYFPEISNEVVTKVNEDGTYETRPAETPMNFIHLMSHSSGLGAGMVREIRLKEMQKKREAAEAEANSDSLANGQRSFGGNKKAKFLEEEMMDLAQYPLGFDPGTDWNYHVSTNMLAYMVERISGMPLQEYVKKEILEPLGMDETDWYYEPEALQRFVKPYSSKDGKIEPSSTRYAEAAVSEEQTYAEGAIGLNGPIEDYAKFCQMLLNGGAFNGNRILKPETIELMTSVNRLPPEHSGADGFQFGLGIELANENKKHVPAVSNSAFSWGGMYGTEYIIDPEHDLIALFYMNMSEREPMYEPYLKEIYELVEGQTMN